MKDGMSVKAGDSVEAKTARGWHLATVDSINADGTIDVTFADRDLYGKKKTGKAWRPSNVRPVDKLAPVWAKIDRSQDGKLSWSELQKAVNSEVLKEAGVSSRSVVGNGQLFDNMDKDGDGVITYPEFKAWHEKLTVGVQLMRLWHSIDTDWNRKLTWKEMEAATNKGKLADLGVSSINTLILEILDMDTDKDGELTFDEFKSYVEKVRSGEHVVVDGDAPEPEPEPEAAPEPTNIMTFWNSIDTDGNRKLTWGELDAAVKAGKLKELGMDSINDLVLEIMDMDHDGSGEVSFMEFKKYVDNVRAGKEAVDDGDAPEPEPEPEAAPVQTNIMTFWNSIDADGNRKLSWKELDEAVKAGKLKELGLDSINDLVLEIIDMDHDGSGEVSFTEFKKYVDDVRAGKEVVDDGDAPADEAVDG